jgi:hypothetical protein
MNLPEGLRLIFVFYELKMNCLLLHAQFSTKYLHKVQRSHRWHLKMHSSSSPNIREETGIQSSLTDEDVKQYLNEGLTQVRKFKKE